VEIDEEIQSLALAIDRAVSKNMLAHSDRDGILNYCICELLLKSLKLGKDRYESYAVYNRLVGILECVKLEIYRRKIAKFEDEKRKENGDVF
jgi:hypothetical protein